MSFRGAFEEVVREAPFGIVQAEYLLFDGVCADEVVDGHILLLSDLVADFSDDHPGISAITTT